jgi:orotidine-5'-phosphate decarboxylase
MFTEQEKIIHEIQMTAAEKLLFKNKQGKFICVGLDSDIKKIPSFLHKEKLPLLEFNKNIIAFTKEHTAAYKINFAFYEERGVEGIKELYETIALIPEDILIIADAKRGDIGNTSEMYARSVFEYFKCDAVTVHPYMGTDSVEPFLNYSDKLIFVLALTSNPGAADFEKLRTSSGKFLYEEVIAKVNQWNKRKNCGIVFGATKIEELKQSINSFNDLAVLLPGVGAQGGSLEDVISAFKDVGRTNFLVNISRGIIYKDTTKNYAESAGSEIISLNTKTAEILA